MCDLGQDRVNSSGRLVRGSEGNGRGEGIQASIHVAEPVDVPCMHALGKAFVCIREGSENMDLTIGSFDEPWDFVPKTHFGAESIIEAWIDTSDLPRTRTDEHEVIVKKWRDAGAEPPPA